METDRATLVPLPPPLAVEVDWVFPVSVGLPEFLAGELVDLMDKDEIQQRVTQVGLHPAPVFLEVVVAELNFSAHCRGRLQMFLHVDPFRRVAMAAPAGVPEDCTVETLRLQ